MDLNFKTGLGPGLEEIALGREERDVMLTIPGRVNTGF